MGSREDDDWFNVKYAEAPECEIHGDTQYYDAESGEWLCDDCQWDQVELDDNEEHYNYG